MTISYKKLKRYLTQELGYTDEEAARAIDGLRGADGEVQQAFAQFWSTGEEPAEVGGMKITDLKRLRELDFVAALLAVDYLKKSPRAARWSLMHARGGMKITQNDLELLRRIARENNWDLDGGQGEENTEDLVIGQ